MTGFLVAQIVKNLPVMQETQVRSPGREVPLEKEMATHLSILARIYRQRCQVGYSPWDPKKLDKTEQLTYNIHYLNLQYLH